MRVYVGEHTPEGGTRVWVTQEEPRPDVAEVTELIGQLRSLSAVTSIDPIERAELLARKGELISRVQAAESVPPPVALVHRRVHSAEGFSWGDTGRGAADLAHSLLTIEAGDEVAASVYLRFRDEVIASLPQGDRFHLPAREVWRWMEANRELIEREAFEQPSLSIVEDAVDAKEDPAALDGSATASAVVSACEAAWSHIRDHHPQLPEAVIVLGSGVERGRLVKLGHWWGGRWLADGEVRGEVLLAGEALHLPADKVFEVLLHEAAHGLNAARGTKDTSRGGRYHNQHFADTAREVLLEVRAMRPYGLAATTLSTDATDRYAATIERLGEAIRIARQVERGVQIGAEGEQGIEGGVGGGSQGKDESKAKGSLAAECGCGRKLRMAPSVLARGPVVCGLCGTEFSTGAEVEVSTADESVVDRSFLDRRRAEVETDRQAGRLLEVVGQKRARLEVALSASSCPDHPALAALRERHARLCAFYERLRGPSVSAIRSPDHVVALSAEQAAAVDRLVAEGGDDHRLTTWYERVGTLHSEPMAVADEADAARLTMLARGLLHADGTLTGPSVEIEGRDFQTGDRVIVNRTVPGGPEAGTLGTVEEADPDLGAVRIDFATWGRVRTPLASALARSLEHDYAAVVDASAERLSEVELDRELERLGPEVEL